MNQLFYLVAGLGKTGYSIAGYLSRRNLPFAVFDTRPETDISDFHTAFPGVEVFLGKLPESIYPQLTEIIASPGISLDEPFLQEAFRRNISVIGDVECLAREINRPVIAITGTNGKSTVTMLVGEMARAAGLSVAVGGNIGLPVLDLLDDAVDYDLWVLELSSFQLDLITSLAPRAAAILNISPDHLDRHHSLVAYTTAKQRIYQHADVLVHNREDRQTFPSDTNAIVKSYGLSYPAPGEWGMINQNGKNYLARGDECFASVDSLQIKGRHNWQNALAACALACAAGIGDQYIQTVLQSFSGLPHRCQKVRSLNGVDWINDSKGTNVGATLSAISGIGGSMQGKIVLIAGGLGKGADFTELRSSMAEYVRTLVLIGADADKIEEAVTDVVPILYADSMEKAVTLAQTQAQPGDVVLLSPACASMDMFRDFNHRGECFTDYVKAL